MHTSRVDLCVAVLGLLMLLSVAQVAPGAPSQNNQPGPVHFEDIAAQVGLTALNVSGGDKHKEFIIETTGNGAIIFDYDNDGWPDIFLPNGSRVEGFPEGQEPSGHLYHNNQNGSFTDVTAIAGLAHPGWGQG